MDNLFLQTVLEGAKRIVGKPRGENQKEPMSTEMVKQVVAHFGRNPGLIAHRLIVICLLGFSRFLRISELVAIRIKDMEFSPANLKLTIPKAKNDQLREGHVVFISRTGTPFLSGELGRKFHTAHGFGARSQ